MNENNPVGHRSLVESNGVNPVPDDERRGRPRGLFAVWFAWNVSVLGIAYGIYVFGLGLNAIQAIVAGTLGYLLSSVLVGVLAVGGPRTGLPTMTQTRYAFGFVGNRVPAFFSYLSNMGWQITIITLASTTFANMFSTLWPQQFASDDGSASLPLLVGCFVVVLGLTMTVSVLGHALIMRVETWISWVTGLMTAVFLALVLPQIEWERVGDTPSGGAFAFLGGVIMAMTLVGLGFLNCGGDFSRYLPRNTKARGVVSWTAAGISLPTILLLVVGVLLVSSSPTLGAAAAEDPITAVIDLLPLWFFVPFSLVIVISLMAAAITGIYSSGLALLAAGAPMRRSSSTALNALIIAAGAFYLLFVSDSFLATFQSFLSLIAVMMGTMGGIQIVDFVRQRRLGWDTAMAQPFGKGGRNWRWSAVLSLCVGTIVGLGLVTSADPNFAAVTGFLLSDTAESGVFGASNIGVVVSLTLGAGLYALLTFGLHIDPRPYSSRVSKEKSTMPLP